MLQAEAVVLQPVVIQQNSPRLLMMDIYLCPKHVEHVRSEKK